MKRHETYPILKGMAIGGSVGWLFVAAAAFAQNLPPATGTGVDFGPLAMQAISIASVVLAGAGAWVARWAIRFLASKAHVQDTQLEDMLAQRVDYVINKGIDYAEAWAKNEVANPNGKIRNVQFDNVFIEMATNYVVDAIPETLSKFNLTPKGIERRVLARLNALMGTPEADSGAPKPVGAAA